MNQSASPLYSKDYLNRLQLTHDTISRAFHREYWHFDWTGVGVAIQKVDKLPRDINRKAVYELKLYTTGRDDPKVRRSWGKVKNSNIPGGGRGSRKIQTCNGSYHCINDTCPYFTEYGIRNKTYVSKHYSIYKVCAQKCELLAMHEK